MKTVVIMLIFISVSAFPVFAEQVNFCHDEKTWEKWENLSLKYRENDDFQALHALRMGLCAKVERGSIEFDRATDIFNRAHELVIEKWKQENRKKELRSKG